MKKNSISDCKVIRLNVIGNRNGKITVVSNNVDIPFKVKRIFYLYDIPNGCSRGGHAHKNCHQFLVSASGSFNVLLDDGVSQKEILLNGPNFGLHILPGVWATEKDFSSGAICLVLASDVYDESDYIRNFKSFIKYKK